MKFPITLQNKKEFKQFLKKYKLEILNYYHVDKKINKLKGYKFIIINTNVITLHMSSFF